MNYDEKNTINISETLIGKDYPCYIIGEIGINHNGDIDIAKKLIDLAITAGANAVKFQKRNLDSLYRLEVLENPNIESQGLEILLDVLKKVELSDSDYHEIIKYCNEKNITFYFIKIKFSFFLSNYFNINIFYFFFRTNQKNHCLKSHYLKYIFHLSL